MKVKKINQREPTKVKVPDKTKASELQKKKLYRQRTVEEVQNLGCYEGGYCRGIG